VNVALLSPADWPEVRRGGERYARELGAGLVERGHAPRLITAHRGPPARAIDDGLPIVRHWRPPEARLRRRLYEDYLTHVPFSYMSLRAGHDDVAVALYPTDALAAVRWSRRTGRPAVFCYLGIPHREGLANRRRRLEIMQRATAGSAAVVALSEVARRGFQRWLGVDARVIAPPVDVDRFVPGRRAECPTIVCPADATQPRKRIPLLLEAFALVRRARPDARLVLSRPVPQALGSGVEARDLDDTATLARAYAEAWVGVLPSWGEAFGLVLAEALACGTPVVGSDRGAAPEIIDRPGIGRIFAGEEPGALAGALLEALELAELPATADACRERALAFSRGRCIDAHLALYAELGAGT
jgi:glycosyltransferase involved in cell wall biosynthesis